MTSVFEGKSIALEEAKILKKPIVITNFSTASEQITDGKTGLIAEMNAQSVAEK
jgi:glycosyltransferase involved in cell wall biosynthesis